MAGSRSKKSEMPSIVTKAWDYLTGKDSSKPKPQPKDLGSGMAQKGASAAKKHREELEKAKNY